MKIFQKLSRIVLFHSFVVTVFSQQLQPSYTKVSKSGSNIDGVRIPLCTYVRTEEKVEDSESGTLILDPDLGCISCRVEVQQQCTKVPKTECSIVSTPVQSCSPSLCEPEIDEDEATVVVVPNFDQVRDNTFQGQQGDVTKVQDNVVEIQQADVGQVLENVPQIPQFNVGQESNEYLTQKTVEPYRPNLNRGPNIEAIEEDEPFREDVEQEGYGSDPGQVLCKDEEVSTRFEFETVCKNYTPRICDDDDDSDCGPTQICYKRPRLLTRDTGTGTRCRKRRSPQRPYGPQPPRPPRPKRPKPNGSRCKQVCSTSVVDENVCRAVDTDVCDVSNVRVCDQVHEEQCLAKIRPSIKLQCKEFAEIALDNKKL